ncbi:MAG: anaerobic ribonucleoside-triphosphate reductase activating protein [Oscillospiraceae bacterium]|nr:anaerobic ribonucleoside-triphosphate reductase activating protein [Oscillospiraceae bacterium]
MKIRIAGINKLSMVNGDGARLVIFLQGCARRCNGCQNPDAWDFEGGEEWDTASLAEYVKDILRKHPLDGITLSGGDPVYQKHACMDLLDRLPEDLNVWLYTGFQYEDIADSPLVRRADVVVDGPFIEDLKCEGQMCGSSNQRIIRKGRT